MAEPVRDGRAGQALASQRLDRVGDLVTEAVWAAMSARGPIDKAGGALGAVTIPPFADGFAGDADRGGEGCHRPAGCEPLDDRQSTIGQSSRIVVDIRPGLRAVGCWPRNHSFSAQPRS